MEFNQLSYARGTARGTQSAACRRYGPDTKHIALLHKLQTELSV